MPLFRRVRSLRLVLETLEERTLLSFAPPVSYPSGINPRDVVAADFNGNGTLDLAVANNQSNNVGLYRGRMNGRFRYLGTMSTGGTEPHFIVAGDWNKDNRLDLAVANYASGDLSVFLGNGNLTFQAPMIYPTGAGSTCVAVGDFDGDGDLDLVTTNRYGGNSGTGTLTVVLGNGDGSFQLSMEYPGGSKPQYVTVTDLNEDGRPDLAVSEGGNNSLGVWINSGSAFTKMGAYATGDFPHGSVAGDFNVDGHADLAVVNYTSNDATLLYGDGAGGFPTSNSKQVGTTPLGVSTGDFNLDGAQDLVVSNRDSDNVGVLLGKGNGDFEPADPYFYDAGDGPSAAAVGDFNADGAPDLAVASWSANGVSVLLNNTDWAPTPLPGIHFALGAFVTEQSVVLDANVETRRETSREAHMSSAFLGHERDSIGEAAHSFCLGVWPGSRNGHRNIPLALSLLTPATVATYTAIGQGLGDELPMHWRILML